MDTKLLMPLESGAIMGSSVTDVQTGAKGTPGELHGKFDLERDLGTLYANTDCGVFGVTDGADDRFFADQNRRYAVFGCAVERTLDDLLRRVVAAHAVDYDIHV